MQFPLTGIRVLDLSSVVVGPVASLRLAQYGAEVIKIESGEGDLLRRLGGASPSGQLAGAYLHLNRGKRSVRLDLKRPAAQRALQRILDRCDVFLTNLRPDALERLGLDAASVRARRPTLIHCIITGFGPGARARSEPRLQEAWTDRRPADRPHRDDALADAIRGRRAERSVSRSRAERRDAWMARAPGR